MSAWEVRALKCRRSVFAPSLDAKNTMEAPETVAVRDIGFAASSLAIHAFSAAMMFAYEAKLKGEQGKWCLEYEGNKKWYEPGVLLRTESASGQNTTEFSYDKSTGNVSATSKSKNKLISSITFSKFGVPLFGKVFSRGVVSKEVSYDELGQVKK